MPLFATLANTEAFANQETSKRPAFPPTAVQLYVNKYISFSSNEYALVDTNTTAPSASNAALAATVRVPKRFEALSYQSSHLPESKNEFRTTKEGSPPSLVVEEPNFGIWDCRCGGNGNAAVMVATLLKRVLPPPSSPPIFLAVVDLAQPHQVQPMLSSMISAIVEYTKKKETTTANEALSSELDSPMVVQQGTTPPSRLTMMEFGTAPSSTNEALPPLPAEEGGGGERSTRSSRDLCIVLCAVLPPTKTTTNSNNTEDVTYKEKQAQNLVRYHLFKYASQIQCTLAFVRHQDPTSNAGTVPTGAEEAVEKEVSPASNGTDAMEGISVQDLAIVIRRLSQNLPPVERAEASSMVVEEESGSEGTQPDTAEQGTSPQPSIYAPGQYDTELIDSAYLRNASCPGVWNANEDDLTVALPPMTKTTTKGGDTGASGKEKTLVDTKRRGGDEEWLTRLADSVTAVPGGMMGDDAVSVIGGRSVRSGRTPAKDSKSSSKKKVIRKKPTSDNKDVSDFFNDLLAK